MKECTKCNIIKTLESFSVDKYKKDGHISQCKECKKEYYKNNKALIQNMTLLSLAYQLLISLFLTKTNNIL